MSKSKFGPRTTVLEVVEGIELSGKEAIVTGASWGSQALGHFDGVVEEPCEQTRPKYLINAI